jgi:hypothetical protein
MALLQGLVLEFWAKQFQKLEYLRIILPCVTVLLTPLDALDALDLWVSIFLFPVRKEVLIHALMCSKLKLIGAV